MLIQINDEHSYDKNRSYIYLYFFLRVGGSIRFKHLKKIPSFEVVQVAFENTAPFREKKLEGDVSINAFLHDVVEFLLKVQI